MNTCIVNTALGQIKGEDLGDISVWRGIPFAKAPEGILRLNSPQPVDSWEGVLDATEFGPHAMQPKINIDYVIGNHEHTNVSEDCLSLNIWAPKDTDKKKPVMVWIHQGGYCAGDAYTDGYYDGSLFAREGIVFVSIQYRLSAFGFLYLGGLSDKYAAGNYGLLDQIEALKWIKNNISAFGGDPDNITVFGQSAGAMSVNTLLVMPAAKGLFKNAIIESTADLVIPKERAEQHAKEFLAKLGIDEKDPDKILEVPAEKLMEEAFKMPLLYFAPVADGITIPDEPNEMMKRGEFNHVNIIIGGTANEYNGFSDFDPNFAAMDEEALFGMVSWIYGDAWDRLDKSLTARPLTHERAVELMTDVMFNFQTVYSADLLSEWTNVWMYRLGIGPEPDRISIHGADIVYVFNQRTPYGPYRIVEGTEAMADLIHSYCTSLARTGDPNHTGAPVWEKYNPEERNTMCFDNDSAEMRCDPFSRRSKYYDAMSVRGYHPQF